MNKILAALLLLWLLPNDPAAARQAVPEPAAAEPTATEPVPAEPVPAQSAASDWQEYGARYSLYRNGKLAGKAEIRLQQEGERWTMSTEGNGTHGLARVLRVKDRELVQGRMVDGRFRPQRFEHRVSVAGIGNSWTALFDWEADTVTVVSGDESLRMDLRGRALDGLSLKLEMQRRLRAGEDDMRFWLVDEDEIKMQEFRVLPREMLETSLGCLETIPVERIRSADSTRYTRAWHAPALQYLTVRMEHGKTDGDHMEMRIAELQLDHKDYPPGMGCSALQSG